MLRLITAGRTCGCCGRPVENCEAEPRGVGGAPLPLQAFNVKRDVVYRNGLPQTWDLGERERPEPAKLTTADRAEGRPPVPVFDLK